LYDTYYAFHSASVIDYACQEFMNSFLPMLACGDMRVELNAHILVVSLP